MSTFEHIIVESKAAVGVITLNRPKMLNALSFGVFREIAAAVDDLEADDKIGCILLAGGEKAFAAEILLSAIVHPIGRRRAHHVSSPSNQRSRTRRASRARRYSIRMIGATKNVRGRPLR